MLEYLKNNNSRLKWFKDSEIYILIVENKL